MAFIKFGNKILKFGGKVVTNDPPPPPPLPPFTIRCKFTSGYTPTMGTSQTLVDADENVWDIVKNSDYWDSLFSNKTQLLQVICANTSSVKSMSQMFYKCSSLTSVPLFDTSSVTNMSQMFNKCSSLTSVPLFDTSSVTNMNSMFKNCIALTSVPLFDTSSVTDMNGMFMWCEALTSVPLFDTSSVKSMSLMFMDCTAVTEGSLALYQQASTQSTPPSSHNNTFNNCGSGTTTGAAELAQIPTSWGGTMST